MNSCAIDFDRLLAVAIDAAQTAGQMIAASRPQQVTRKEGGSSLASQVLTEVDGQAQKIILEALAPTIGEFDLALLAEESEDDRSRFEKDFFWCIDPIDGTLPFIEGNPGYSVSIALVARDGTPHIGVIYDPVEKNCWHAVRGGGICKNGRPWQAGFDQAMRLQLITDRSFHDSACFDEVMGRLERIADEMGLAGVDATKVGGAAMNAVWVLENAPACYFKFPKPQDGGGSLWDFAASACLFAEAGAVATDFSGAPLDLNRADSTFMNHRGIMLASDAALAKKIRLRPGGG
jgi:3'-phosphoadenosine 5'-phosphosulfate (PAPS) 3'-phosphatase